MYNIDTIKKKRGIKMFKLTVRTHTTKENIVFAVRETAETYAERYYTCCDVYAVEVIDNITGELLYYRSKGDED